MSCDASKSPARRERCRDELLNSRTTRKCPEPASIVSIDTNEAPSLTEPATSRVRVGPRNKLAACHLTQGNPRATYCRAHCRGHSFHHPLLGDASRTSG